MAGRRRGIISGCSNRIGEEQQENNENGEDGWTDPVTGH
jgi:hypothetical protein